MKTILILTIALWCIQNVLATTPVDPTQLAAWQALFDSTGGLSWSSCKGKRDKPCDCSGTVSANVVCTTQNGVKFISAVRMNNNNLAAANVPTDSINTIIGQFTPFASFDLSGNTKMHNSVGGCLNIPNCANTNCKFDFTVCKATTGSPSATPAPGPATTSAPTVSSLNAWKGFFDGTGGASWTKCKTTRTTPCDCQKNQPTTAPVRVVCTGTTITRVSLVSNNLVATSFPGSSLNGLILAGATFVDLTNNTALAPSVSCFDVPACTNPGVTCNLPKPLCGVTTPPSSTDSPTASQGSESPTTSPVATSTVSPTAGSPVPTTVAPTTAAPTSSAPTTGAPTTHAPTPVLSPTTLAPSTVAPTFNPATTHVPTTFTPTASQTASPTSAGTEAPTQPQLSTSSPTPSAAILANGLMASVAGVLVASVMLML